ncbi:MAG: UDP-glucose 4-epimerase GalE [Gammaproteobacteria bacterium]|nr:UDP-glucose 4-epimerase GalE [Gammaproteobacteria bacterium]
MNILVTGGAGYIGTHVALELLAAGWEPVLLDDFSNASPAAMLALDRLAGRTLRSVEGDIRDPKCLDGLLEQHNFSAVVHLAALKAVGESVAEPLRYYSNNLGGTACLLERMAHHGVTSLVFSSTAIVYAPSETPLTEHAPTRAESPYARTKLAAEEMMRDLAAADPGWGISILRYFNAGGADPSGLIGESPPDSPKNLLPQVADVATGRRKRLSVFGNDYPTPDGTCIRDYVHVVDIARAHVRAVERVVSEPGVSIHNLGTGRGHSVLEAVEAFERASGVAIPYEFAPRRPGDVAMLRADSSLARRELGWTATFDLDCICADLWRWRSGHPDGYAG